ncbi:hypothetical protein A5707_21385 [Mycobacterium kyorinense]|uniref:Uncharacterized protein n=1 Tax=Mycobacterium kyorinense TaxID=487514 RepID=A0A1A2ZAC7_9MYCO|nr:hypothetical protein A5707_21385 [Mycobacterium kyorinense]
MGSVGWLSDRWHDLANFGATAWLGLALWVMAAIALLALIYVRYHLSRLRRLSFEDNRPQVTMFMEPHAADWHLVELVVRNFGQRTAYDVQFHFSNPPTVAEYENAYEGMVDITELHLPEELPELAPSQEWRTVWDSALDRHQLGGAIASRFAGTATYYDSPAPSGRWRKFKARRRKPIETKIVLDWGTLPPVQRIDLMTTHDLAKREKQKLELLRCVLTYFQVASQETRPDDVRNEIDRIKHATQDIRNRWRSRQLEEPTDVRMRRVDAGRQASRDGEPDLELGRHRNELT